MTFHNHKMPMKMSVASVSVSDMTKIHNSPHAMPTIRKSYSAKQAIKGKDIGKPGKMFAKIAASAAKRYGSKERGEKVAGAVLAKLRKKY